MRSLSERRFRPYNIRVMTSVVNSVASTANATNLPLMVSRRSVRSERVIFSQMFTEATTFTFMAQTTIDGRLEASRTTTCEVGRGSPESLWYLTRKLRRLHPPYRGTASQMARRFFSLPIEPVREFHQEPVVGPQIEQLVHVATEAARPLDPRGPLATLTPHDEQGRPRPVLPAEHDIRAELLEVEAGSGGGSCRRRGGGASGDWLASVTAARNGHPRSMKSRGGFLVG